MMKLQKALTLLSASILASAVPITAHANTGAAKENVTPKETEKFDPARISAAEKTVDHLFPLGTYERMMRGTMDKMINGMMSKMMDMPASELAKMGGMTEEQAKTAGKETMADLAKKKDPHFRERMDTTMSVMMEEMVTLMSSMEPAMREALAKIYTRKYTVKQLTEMNTFFESETGALFARDYMMVFVDEEMMSTMMQFAPKMIGAMPRIIKKVEKATEHLPKPPKASEQKPAEDKEDLEATSNEA